MGGGGDSLPGVDEQEGVADGGEEVEDAQFVHLSSQFVLPALLALGFRLEDEEHVDPERDQFQEDAPGGNREETAKRLRLSRLRVGAGLT